MRGVAAASIYGHARQPLSGRWIPDGDVKIKGTGIALRRVVIDADGDFDGAEEFAFLDPNMSVRSLAVSGGLVPR